MQIIKYQTEEEAQIIIAEKILQGFILTDVSNIGEGNFLGFTEEALIPIVGNQPTNEEIAETQMTILSGVADVYMATLGL